jgi:NDP-sugar pyrophosphorylase family protein
VTDAPALDGGILAAGAGSRLRADGFPMAKLLVPVAGVPLIEHVVRNFVSAGITPLSIIVSEEASHGAVWVRTRFPDLDVRVITKTTGSSLESFQEIARRASGARTLISTVDAWCPVDDFVRFVETARRYPDDATVLAVTPFVADERPLWATLDAAGRLTRLDGDSGAVVTAGLYLVPERVRRMVVGHPTGRLREFLAWLVERGEPLYGIPIPIVVDVDRAHDVALAEALAKGTSAGVAGPGEKPR